MFPGARGEGGEGIALCATCQGPLDDLPSGDAHYRGCKKCGCIWIYSKDDLLIRRLKPTEDLVMRDGLYYFAGGEKGDIKLSNDMKAKVEAAKERQRELGDLYPKEKKDLVKAKGCGYRVNSFYCEAPNRKIKFCDKIDEQDCDDAIRK